MGHDKLRKFAENETFSCLIQPSADELLSDGFLHLRDHAMKGHWAERLKAASGDPAEIVLELGCGKGEYTLELARRNPQNIYIGVDIKGARLWRGAKTATQEALPNVAFLRTRIEFINAFFAPGEVSQIWLTFSDPQMKSENSRLTSPVFLERYRKFLRPGGTVHLKTDSRFLHEYTKAVVAVNGFRLLACTDNLYGDALGGIPAEVREVQTYYESMFLRQGLPISYMAFTIDGDGPIAYPRDPEDFDSKAMRAAEKAR
ncbi:MAG: tRNA (guanosine(46)-N7)-methyltransferase TrmB [Bacteroidales bacterium]|nr:tRNA (guanosine(46)-N7)-methyltransferase TrmB [Bacteroidales bacterium]